MTGEAGIGKSRFCREVAMRARKLGWHVLSGTCDVFASEGRPLVALQQMVPAIGDLLELHAPDELERTAWKALARLAAEQADQAPASDIGSLVELATIPFRELSRRIPLLVIVDDLHWAGPSTVVLFRALDEVFRKTRGVLLGSYREHEVDRNFREALAAVHRNGQPELVRLQPLTRDEAMSIADALGGDSARFDEIYGRSAGNAYFFEELFAEPGARLPGGVREVVLGRLARLSPASATVIEAACLESGASLPVLADVLAVSTEQIAAALDEASELALTTVDAGRCYFQHALVREAIYEHLPSGRRSLLHERMADTLERLEPGRAAEAATHWRQTANVPRSILASLRAAEQADGIGARHEAALHFEHALAALPYLPGDAPSLMANTKHALADSEVPITRTLLIRETALAWEAAGEVDRAIDLLEDALSRPWELAAGEKAGLWMRLGTNYCLSGTAYDKALEAFRHSIALVDDDAPLEFRVGILCQFAIWVDTYGLDAEAGAALEQAEQLVPNTRAVIPRLLTLIARAKALAQRGDLDSAKVVREAIALREQTPFTVLLDCTASECFEKLGLHELNLHENPRFGRLAIEQGFGDPYGFGIDISLARSQIRLGRWSEALSKLPAWRERLGEDRIRKTSDIALFGWGSTLARAGRIEEATAWTEAVSPFPSNDTVGEVILTRVELARVAGDPHAAARAVDGLIERAWGHRMAHCGEAVSFAIGLLADHREVSTLPSAESWVERLRGCIADTPGRAILFDVGMFIEQSEAELERLRGNDDARTWEDLAERWESLPRPYQAAYAHLRAASALLMDRNAPRSESRPRAGQHLARVIAVCRDLGAVFLEADANRLRSAAGLRELGSSSPRPTPQPSPAGPKLTAREREVLHLLVDGQSNGQIAIALGITVKTASVHVSNILRKLDADNRVAAAVNATRSGLLEGTPVANPGSPTRNDGQLRRRE